MPRQMKDSGVEWIGEIPADWNIIRIGSQYTERKTKVSDTEYPPLSVTMNGVLPQLATAAKTDAHDDRKLVCKGDFAINSRSDRRGSCGISPYDGSVSLINIILAPRDEMNPNYYDWLFHSTMFSDEFYKWGHGIVDDLWTTNWQDMKRISIPEPSIKEQQRIADFLDHICAEIDAVIEKTKATIEEYKKLKQSVITEAVTKGIRGDRPMKDSGIERIGEIPEEWNVGRVKFISEFEPSTDRSKLKDDSIITYTPMDCIKNGWFVNNTATLGNVSSSLTAYQEGDIVIAKVTPCFENGNIAIMKNLMSGFGLGSSELFVLRATYIETEYLFYWLRNDDFMQAACSTMTGTGGLKRVSPDFVKNCYIHIPPAVEQQEIADYLNRKCAEFDKLIADKTHLLEELENYKKSVIYEYVTGKKEVI